MARHDPLTDLVRVLTDVAPPRTWSMLATIFGDMAAEPGTRLPGPLVARLTAAMGIRPSALRTALHRLRRDGWIESARSGRLVTHALTDRARAETRAARPRVYDRDASADLYLVLIPPGEAPPPGTVAVTPEVGLSRHPAGWSRPAGAPPDWMRDRVAPPDLMAQMAEVASRLDALRALPLPAAGTAEAAVLRLLVVHLWRRVALKAPDLPDAVFPEGWRGAAARTAARDLLARLPPIVVAGAASPRPPWRQNGESG